jgi:glycosyltransferase involved in cell wall biosynthesis
MKYRICIIVPAHWEAIMGGSQYQAKLLVQHLIARYDVDLFYLTTIDDPTSRPTGYRIVRFSDRKGFRRFGSFFDAFRLYRTLRDIRPHAIVQYVGSAHTGIAAWYARRHGCEMIWRVTNDRSVVPPSEPWWKVHRHIERAFLDYGIRNANWILAQSNHQLDQIVRRFRRNNVTVLPNFHPVPPDRVPEAGPRKRVLWIANLKPLKNPHAFVRLAQGLAHRRDISFVMIGRAMERDDWTAGLLAQIESVPNLEYWGFKTQDEVNQALANADLLVCTSHYEGFSNTFIQAWMRRVPVVSLVVDPDHLLTRGRLGALSRTEEQLQRDVTLLLDDVEERMAMGERCRRYAVHRHNESNIDVVTRLLTVPELASP